MKKYARIKEYKGKLENYLTDGKWYEIIEDASQPDPNSTYFKLVHGLAVYDNSANSNHLVGGSWEIVEGTEIPYGIVGCIGVTKCKFVDGNTVGCIACNSCKYHIKDDQVNQIVTCGYPVEEPELMSFFEADFIGKLGEIVKHSNCDLWEHTITNKYTNELKADSGDLIPLRSARKKQWRIIQKKKEIKTINIKGGYFRQMETAFNEKPCLDNLTLGCNHNSCTGGELEKLKNMFERNGNFKEITIKYEE